MTELSIGFSPCPNDTFIFNALVNGMVSTAGFTLRPEILTDVETLNKWAMEGRLDITKLSFHALMYVRDKYTLLRSGAALGRGCGPLLIHKAGGGRRINAHDPIALPGRYTTAALLLRLAYPEFDNFVYLPFERIMPAVISGETAAGVIIHESRFTYRDFGLEMIRDLGAWWEEETGHPIPLGGIAARRSLGADTIHAIETAIAGSIAWAFEHDDCRQPYIKEHAQEMADEVIGAHIGLYVNDFSRDLGVAGMAAVEEFWHRGTILV
ncbi:1,4-dihydroxy-6-naphthoate synthase [Desulfobacterota bacterium M19]